MMMRPVTNLSVAHKIRWGGGHTLYHSTGVKVISCHGRRTRSVSRARSFWRYAGIHVDQKYVVIGETPLG